MLKQGCMVHQKCSKQIEYMILLTRQY